MTQNLQDELLMFEEQILKRLHSAQRRFQHARDEQMKRYYKGQVDALSVALHEMRTIKFEAGAELSEINFQIASEQPSVPETSPAVENLNELTHEIVEIPEEGMTAAPKRRGRRKKQEEKQEEETVTPKKRGRKPAAPPAPKTVYQLLAREAIDLKVLPRKSSWFYHELLPHGIIKGLYQLEKMLEENVTFREAIQAACEEKKAFIPAEESETTSESAPEQSEVTTDKPPLEQPMAGNDAPASEQAEAVTEKKRRGRRKQAETVLQEETAPKKRGRKSAAPLPPKVSEYQQLAREAIDLGVLPRKSSWFYHELLPQGLIKGLYQLEKALEYDVTLREAIQAACAEKKAFVPAEEVVTVLEPITNPEPITEPFQEAA